MWYLYLNRDTHYLRSYRTHNLWFDYYQKKARQPRVTAFHLGLFKRLAKTYSGVSFRMYLVPPTVCIGGCRSNSKLTNNILGSYCVQLVGSDSVLVYQVQLQLQQTERGGRDGPRGLPPTSVHIQQKQIRLSYSLYERLRTIPRGYAQREVH